MPDIQANGLSFHYDSRGPESEGTPVILMIMGLGVQMVLWPEPLLDALAQQGFRVVRFDNRDIGLSSHLDHLGVPNIALEMLKIFAHLPLKAPYLIDDMADDTVALIDSLKLGRPHVVGASMGGMIGQALAARHPEKVSSLTSIMSTTGRRSLPQPTWQTRRALIEQPPKPGDTDAAIARMIRVISMISSRSHPPDPAHLRSICERHILRSNHPAGAARQLLAIAASGDRTRAVRQIKAPTLVIHGNEDPLVRAACGIETAQVIREGGGNATLSMIEGMGHDFPLPLIPHIAAQIAVHCKANSLTVSPAPT